MVDAIANLLTGGAAGAATGILASFGTSVLNLFVQKNKDKHELALIAQERLTMEMEAQNAIKIQDSKTRGETELVELQALTESYKGADKQLFTAKYMEGLPKWVASILAVMFGLVDVLKSSARPVLTYYMMIACSYLTLVMIDVIQANGGRLFTPAEASAIFHQLVNTIIYLAVSAFTWHFADRQTAKFLMRLNDGNSKG